MCAQFPEEADIASVEVTVAQSCNEWGMIGDDVAYSLTLTGSHMMMSVARCFLLLSPSMSLWQCVFWEHSQFDDFGYRVLGLYNIRAKICVR